MTGSVTNEGMSQTIRSGLTLRLASRNRQEGELGGPRSISALWLSRVHTMCPRGSLQPSSRGAGRMSLRAQLRLAPTPFRSRTLSTPLILPRFRGQLNVRDLHALKRDPVHGHYLPRGILNGVVRDVLHTSHDWSGGG